MAIGTDKDNQKKLIGELLKAADRFIKSADWNKALDEVGKALAITILPDIRAVLP